MARLISSPISDAGRPLTSDMPVDGHARRHALLAAAALAAVAALPACTARRPTMATTQMTSAAPTPPPTLDPVPPLPATPTPGKPGDFDFLAGEWRIRHQWRASPEAEWLAFEGEATCWTILGGVCSVEELRIPARDFHGMGLRLFDVGKRQWIDHWVNAKSGLLGRDGQPGSFEDGVGIFIGDDVQDGKPIKAGGLWDRITPTSCRWRQVLSRDGGRSWLHTWVMEWRRV